MCLGSAQARTNVRSPGWFAASSFFNRCNCVSPSPCVTSTAMEVIAGNECADDAAAIGALGPVSNRNIVERWPPPRFDSTNLWENCNNIVCTILVASAHRPIRPVLHVSIQVRTWPCRARYVASSVNNIFCHVSERATWLWPCAQTFCAHHALFLHLRCFARTISGMAVESTCPSTRST